MLKHFNGYKMILLETDASNLTLTDVLSQYNNEVIPRPVAFVSKNYPPAETNYEIYDKELIVIVQALKE